MLLSNTLVYNHKMECGSDDVAMATLKLNNWASIRNVSTIYLFISQQLISDVCVWYSQTIPSWLAHIIDPAHPVVFINTDKVDISMLLFMRD